MVSAAFHISCLLRPLSAQIRGAGVAIEKVLRAREGDGPGWQDFTMDEIPGAVWACGVSVSAGAAVGGAHSSVSSMLIVD